MSAFGTRATIDCPVTRGYYKNCDPFEDSKDSWVRVLQARAQLSIDVGNLGPQTQQMTGDYTRNAVSKETAGQFFSLNDDGTGVQRFADFMTLLAPPPRGPVSLEAQVGDGIFTTIGCANCHTRVLVTGNSPVAALSHKEFQPFSDFLLHDMGSLGDGIVQGSATARQMRTAPLWGVRTRLRLLHDGRATSLDAAILAHDGQARPARDRFTELDAVARQALIAFLKSL